MKKRVFVRKTLAMLSTTMSKKKLAMVTILALLSVAMLQSATCNVDLKRTVDQPSIPQAFRLLAVEIAPDNVNGTARCARSAERLIEELLRFPNWSNITSTYVSYIHLLTRYTRDEVPDMLRPFWTGNSTRANVRNELLNFLGKATPNETVIFYFQGYGLNLSLYCSDTDPQEVIQPQELTSWLSSGSLSQATVCVILDACHSGSWIEDGKGGVLGPGRLVLAGCRSDQSCWTTNPADPYDYFTGLREANYHNGTIAPLGIVGGLVAANDSNGDGWISCLEDFAFAKASVDQNPDFSNPLDPKQNPVCFNGLPNQYDPPLVLIPRAPTANFTNSPSVTWPNETMIFNASNSFSQNGNISSFRWNFGDGNITTVSQALINHSYTSTGKYNVTLNVTDSSIQWNVTSSTITVTYRTDINKDGTVNILDITIVAAAYNTGPSDEKWNGLADLDKNGIINILDISLVARDYGKTV